MKKWKILVLIPYLLIGLWELFWFFALTKFGLVGIFVSTIFLIYGLAAFIVYTIILGIGLLIKRLVKKR